MTRALSLLLVLGLLGACSADGSPSTSLPSRTATTATVPSTSGTSTTATPASTTTRPAVTTPRPSAVPNPAQQLLQADGSGVKIVDGPVFTDEPAAIAFPDHRGGVVYQAPADAWHWEWDADTQLAALVLDADADPRIVWHIAHPGATRSVLVNAAGPVRLEQVTRVEGRPSLLYRAMEPLPSDCPTNDAECLWYAVVFNQYLLDLTTGSTRNLGHVAAFESSYLGLRLGGRWMVVVTETYGRFDGCGSLWPITTLDSLVPNTWIGAGGLLSGRCDFGTMRDCDNCEVHFSASIAPDGRSLIFTEVPVGSAEPGGAAYMTTDPLGSIATISLAPSRALTVADFDGSAATVTDGEQWYVLTQDAFETLPPASWYSVWVEG